MTNIEDRFAMKDVTSSQVRRIGYDASTREMRVEFKTKDPEVFTTYSVHDIGPEKHAAIMAHDSKGKAYNEHVKKGGLKVTKL